MIKHLLAAKAPIINNILLGWTKIKEELSIKLFEFHWKKKFGEIVEKSELDFVETFKNNN